MEKIIRKTVEDLYIADPMAFNLNMAMKGVTISTNRQDDGLWEVSLRGEESVVNTLVALLEEEKNK